MSAQNIDRNTQNKVNGSFIVLFKMIYRWCHVFESHSDLKQNLDCM